MPAARLIDLAAALQKATADLYYSTNRRTDAELCLLRLCDETLSGDLTALAARMDRLEEGVRRGQILRSAVTAQTGQDPPARKPAPVPEAAPVPEDTPPWEDRRRSDRPCRRSPRCRRSRASGCSTSRRPRLSSRPAARGPELIPEPAGPAPEAPQSPAAAADGSWWRALAEGCKGRLPPMYRVFLDMCTGVLEGDLLTVYAPDDITLGRLDNDRVRGRPRRGGRRRRRAGAAGPPGGRAPQGHAPKENLQNLLKFGSQFDNIEIK